MTITQQRVPPSQQHAPVPEHVGLSVSSCSCEDALLAWRATAALYVPTHVLQMFQPLPTFLIECNCSSTKFPLCLLMETYFCSFYSLFEAFVNPLLEQNFLRTSRV